MATQVNRVALVTGAGRGIGAAIALELAAQGARVVVNYAERADDANSTVAAIRAAGGDAFSAQADVQDPQQLARLFAAVSQKYGRLDILVNNAGVGGTAMLDELNADTIDRVLAVNVRAVLLATQRAVRAFSSSGGAIVNLSSALALQPVPAQALYAATKGAIDALTRVLARELGPLHIRVNAVAPGPTEAGLLQIDEQTRGYLISRTPLGRIGIPADTAKVVAFLASDAAAWITGQVIGADGGLRV
ncbi:MAG TPA: glucose 1-dehydrogenase [Steroidobacteraceae bacterium]